MVNGKQVPFSPDQPGGNAKPLITEPKPAVGPLGRISTNPTEEGWGGPTNLREMKEETLRHALGDQVVDKLYSSEEGKAALKQLGNGTHQNWSDTANYEGVLKPKALADATGKEWTPNDFKRTVAEHGKNLNPTKELVARHLADNYEPADIMSRTEGWGKVTQSPSGGSQGVGEGLAASGSSPGSYSDDLIAEQQPSETPIGRIKPAERTPLNTFSDATQEARQAVKRAVANREEYFRGGTPDEERGARFSIATRRSGPIARQIDTPERIASMHERAEQLINDVKSGKASPPEGLGKIPSGMRGGSNWGTSKYSDSPTSELITKGSKPDSGVGASRNAGRSSIRGPAITGHDLSEPESVYLGNSKYGDLIPDRAYHGPDEVPAWYQKSGTIGTGEQWASPVSAGGNVDPRVLAENPEDMVSLLPTTATEVQTRALLSRTRANAEVARLQRAGMSWDDPAMVKALDEKRAAEVTYQKALRKNQEISDLIPSKKNVTPMESPYTPREPGDLIPEKRTPSKSLEDQMKIGQAREAIDKRQEESARSNFKMTHPASILGPREGEFNPKTGELTSKTPTLDERLEDKKTADLEARIVDLEAKNKASKKEASNRPRRMITKDKSAYKGVERRTKRKRL